MPDVQRLVAKHHYRIDTLMPDIQRLVAKHHYMWIDTFTKKYLETAPVKIFSVLFVDSIYC